MKGQRDKLQKNPFIAIDHVQLAMPPGQEPAARHFFVDLLGMIELPKPPALVKRGGCWFESGKAQIHLGVENEFHPARKAHPALRCRDYVELLAKLRQQGVEVTEANAAFFDAAQNFAGCIPGLHEVLRRQGLLEGLWCLDPNESLSPGQREEIDRVYRAYPHLNDDEFVAQHRDEWLGG